MVTHTHIHTHTHDNYYNPRCAHAHRGLTTVTLAAHACRGLNRLNNFREEILAEKSVGINVQKL